MAKIILVCGLPGTGKSTLAEFIAEKLHLPLFSKDTLEASLVEHGVLNTDQLNGVGYTLLKNLVSEHLNRQTHVVLDFIGDKNRVNRFWPDLESNEILSIECVCSDREEHRKRIETRDRNIKGWYELEWSDVELAKNRYQPLMDNNYVVDTSKKSCGLDYDEILKDIHVRILNFLE